MGQNREIPVQVLLLFPVNLNQLLVYYLAVSISVNLWVLRSNTADEAFESLFGLF